MKDGFILVTTEDVNSVLPEEIKLEKDIHIHKWENLIPYDYYKSVALFSKNHTHRLAKSDTKIIESVLENVTGYKWEVDSVSNFVFHLKSNQIPIKEE